MIQKSYQSCLFFQDSPIFETMPSGGPGNFLERFASIVDRGVMFCGAQHGAMDKFALMIFPVCFFLFTIIYWTTYLSEAYRAMNRLN